MLVVCVESAAASLEGTALRAGQGCRACARAWEVSMARATIERMVATIEVMVVSRISAAKAAQRTRALRRFSMESQKQIGALSQEVAPC